MLLSSIFVLSLPFIISQEYIQENCINVDNHNILPYKYNDTTEKYSLTVNTALPFSIINPVYKKTLYKEDQYHVKIDQKYISSYQYVHSNKNINLFNKTISNMIYYTQSEDDLYLHNQLGMQYKFPNDSYSIIHVLYNIHLIKNKQFAFSHNNKEKEDSLYIGGVNDKLIRRIKNKGRCDVNEKRDEWSCKLSSIYNNISFDINNDILINTGFEDMIYSNRIFYFFEGVFLDKEYKSKECATIKEIPFKSIQCSLPSIQSHEEVLKVSIGSMVIDLPFKSLFVDSLLTIHENPYNTKEIVFGNQFIRLFNFTVFDYDNKRIELYSDSILIKDKNFVDKYIYTQSMYKMTMTNMIMLSFQSVILALFQLVHKYNIYK